jgi:hypothetical protein
MRIRRLSLVGSAAVAVSLAASAVLAAASAVAAASPVPRFRLSDPQLAEVSGLAIGHRSPSVLYVQNDSGDSARFFALDARAGTVRAVCAVPGARNVDWEDLATGPDRTGHWSVWLADIGDNGAARPEVRIYRVSEPIISAGTGTAGRLDTGPPDVWRLRYPDGPHDAESLVADPVGRRLYVITKALLGHSEVFEVPPDPDPARIQPMTRVGTIDFRLTGTPGGPSPVGQLTATGAGMSPDGSLLAVRTYTDAYLWPVTGGQLAAALRRPPVRIPLPAQPQGEGIAVTADALLLDSEGTGTPVYSVPLPASLLARRSGAPTDAGSTGARPASAATASPSPTSTAPSPGSTTGNRTADWLVSTATIGALAAVALLARRRRRPRRR